jgi:LysR family transcriptional regulator, low CO2-responsive transcriptional regulator
MWRSSPTVKRPIREPLSGRFLVNVAPFLGSTLSLVTLNQLKVFVLVVRLGSFRAAANALGVSEPAVSQAITALRQSLGDPLLNRASNGIELTAAGQRIVGLASQMVNLATEAEAAVRQAQGGPSLLRVVSTATPGEAVVPALLQAFSARAEAVEASLGIAATDEMAALLVERLADVAIGPALEGPASPGVVSEPLLRYRLIVVARTGHSLLKSGAAVPRRALADQEWLVDPSGNDPLSDVGQLLRLVGVPEYRVSVFPTARAAWAAAAAGDGVAPAVEHLLSHHAQPALSVMPVVGMPLDLMWHANMLAGDRRSPITTSLRRFLSAPEAMQAMFRADGRVPASRFKPPVYVTIWS